MKTTKIFIIYDQVIHVLTQYIFIELHSVSGIFALPVWQGEGEEEIRKTCSQDVKTLKFSGKDRYIYSQLYFKLYSGWYIKRIENRVL